LHVELDASGNQVGFVAKLDSTLEKVLFSTFVDGTPTSVAIDSTGNAYVVGNTADSAFPVTGPLFGGVKPLSGIGPTVYTFVSRMSADGSKPIFSRLPGGGVRVGELATMYGVGLGSSTGLVGTPDQNGLYPRQLGGVSMLFAGGADGPAPRYAAAPLLYVSSDQIKFSGAF
jgi:hypothetical protein